MSSTDVNLLCTVNEKEREKGRYWVKIDVVQKKKADDKLKQRNKEGFTGKAGGLLGGGKSHSFPVGDDDVISFEIEEALKPMTKFKEGQDRLKCRNVKKDIISREIHLVPNEDSPENHAAITFYHTGESLHERDFLHQVTISDICKDIKQDSIRSNRLSESGGAASLGLEAEPIPPEHDSAYGLPSTESSSSGGGDDDNGNDDDDDDDDDDGTTTVSGNTTTTTSTRLTQSTRSTEIGGSSCMDEIKLPSVFSNKSLQVLSDALGPGDARRLLVHLNMEEAHINAELQNHPRDCALAYANLFVKWQKKEIHRGEASMRLEMEKSLGRINRNDIKMKFMKFASEDVELTPDDFKGMMG